MQYAFETLQLENYGVVIFQVTNSQEVSKKSVVLFIVTLIKMFTGVYWMNLEQNM